MVKVVLHGNFVKKYQKLNARQKKKFSERRDLFIKNPFDISLNNHSLKGKYKGFYSFNVTGDIRVIFEMVAEDTAYFVTIDSHSNLHS